MSHTLVLGWTLLLLAGCAPWLRPRYPVDDVRAFFEDEYRATLSSSGIDGLQYPEYTELSIDVLG